MKTPARYSGFRLTLIFCLTLGFGLPGWAAESWVGTWATSAFREAAKDQPTLTGTTLRQVVHVSIGGHRVRLQLSNVFGPSDLVLSGVHLAMAKSDGAIDPGTDRALTFQGRTEAVIPAGAVLLSDAVDFDLPPLADAAITMQFKQVPEILTTHPGSRATSYAEPGAALAAPTLPTAAKVVHWYFLGALDVMAPAPSGAVVALGDSITDGHGTTTDHNNRWTDILAQRLQANPATAHVGVLNQGIGGNRLLRDGLGPNMLARFNRDVLVQTGVRWVIVQAGINDIGTRLDARKHGWPYASADAIIGADEQLIARAHARGLKIYGATISPYGGCGFYWSADGEADRQTINHWIRTSGQFDAVIDFDAALRDPKDPGRLAPVFDKGDHLHPSLAGYAEMARVVDLALFGAPSKTAQP